MLNSNTAFSWLKQVWIFRHSHSLPSSFLSSFRHLMSLPYRNGWVVVGTVLHHSIRGQKTSKCEDVWRAHLFETSGSQCDRLPPHKRLQDRGHPEPASFGKPQEDRSMVKLRIWRPQTKYYSVIHPLVLDVWCVLFWTLSTCMVPNQTSITTRCKTK